MMLTGVLLLLLLGLGGARLLQRTLRSLLWMALLWLLAPQMLGLHALPLPSLGLLRHWIGGF